MGIKKPKLKEGQTATYAPNPYYDEILIFGDTKVPTSQEKYILIDPEKGFYKKNDKTNVNEFHQNIKARLEIKRKKWWPFKDKLEVVVNIGGPKNYIEHKDLDNYLKTIFDAIKGIVIEDDHQIISVTIDKQENPFTSGLSIAIRQVKNNDEPYIYGTDPDNWEQDRQLKLKSGGICCMDSY